ncbi:hypothetical protein PR001_g10824 [Phytophthora rubi]|uniref:Uncharacterized protein n=1 Tax=Phytophthora rubi TaxID=129364 RepID=A0A6A3MHH9_9STRA|nr:hypothetical protein PR001_g10824 [Phytophthora rubi]
MSTPCVLFTVHCTLSQARHCFPRASDDKTFSSAMLSWNVPPAFTAPQRFRVGAYLDEHD